MDRVAVFVDAGYLFAQGSKELCGTKRTRGNIHLDHTALVAALKDFAEKVSELPLLRIYWYDGTPQGPTPQHIALAYQMEMKVRLGFVNSEGQQKGVDSLVVTDMLTLARNRAMADCVLLSGDEDLRVGVQQAQEYGVRVHLLGIKPAKGSQSVFLLQEADSTHEWNADDLRAFLKCVPMTDLPTVRVDERANTPASIEDNSVDKLSPNLSGRPDERLRQVARQIADEVPDAEVHTLIDQIRATGQRPPQIDGKLLAKSRSALGGCDLDSIQKSEVRGEFLKALEMRVCPGDAPVDEPDRPVRAP